MQDAGAKFMKISKEAANRLPQLIVQGRLDPELIPGSRRKSEWLNLAIDDIDSVRCKVLSVAMPEDDPVVAAGYMPFRPVRLNVFASNENNQNMLMESWVVHFSNNKSTANKRRDNVAGLYKKAVILSREVYCLLRALPLQRIVRRIRRLGQGEGREKISYEIRSAEDSDHLEVLGALDDVCPPGRKEVSCSTAYGNIMVTVDFRNPGSQPVDMQASHKASGAVMSRMFISDYMGATTPKDEAATKIVLEGDRCKNGAEVKATRGAVATPPMALGAESAIQPATSVAHAARNENEQTARGPGAVVGTNVTGRQFAHSAPVSIPTLLAQREVARSDTDKSSISPGSMPFDAPTPPFAMNNMGGRSISATPPLIPSVSQSSNLLSFNTPPLSSGVPQSRGFTPSTPTTGFVTPRSSSILRESGSLGGGRPMPEALVSPSTGSPVVDTKEHALKRTHSLNSFLANGVAFSGHDNGFAKETSGTTPRSTGGVPRSVSLHEINKIAMGLPSPRGSPRPGSNPRFSPGPTSRASPRRGMSLPGTSGGIHLNVSPFRDSKSGNGLLPVLERGAEGDIFGMTLSNVSRRSTTSRGSALTEEDELPFAMASTVDEDHEDDLGSFIKHCQDAPSLSMFEKRQTVDTLDLSMFHEFSDMITKAPDATQTPPTDPSVHPPLPMYPVHPEAKRPDAT